MSEATPSATPSADERLQKALGLALAQLNRRERTVGEVRRHLERKGVGPQDAEAAIELLVQDRYLDDSRYALMYVHDKRELEGWGSERISRELGNRGLDREVIQAALAQYDVQHAPGQTELDRALAMLERRFPDPPRDRRDRDRALGMLIRKGFEGELALDALSTYARAA